MRLIDIAACTLSDPPIIKLVDPLEHDLAVDRSYAILSHRWGYGEVTYEDLTSDQWPSKIGASKLVKAVQTAQSNGYRYLWMDTCCIDKRSSSELSEAINSMFRWYRDATVCLVYMSDVNCASPEDLATLPDQFKASRWFTRGWTLQELLAPNRVKFFSSAWVPIGTKDDWAETIHNITGIPLNVLGDPMLIGTHSIATRMSWAADRTTQRPEDLAYSLLGIFDVHMPLVYGEGHRAFSRLQEEILKRTDDCTLYAWRRGVGTSEQRSQGLLADSPQDFKYSGGILPYRDWRKTAPTVMTSRGLDIELGVTIDASGVRTAILPCAPAGMHTGFITIYIEPIPGLAGQYTRCQLHTLGVSYQEGDLTRMYFRGSTHDTLRTGHLTSRIPAMHRIALLLEQANFTVLPLAAQQRRNTGSAIAKEWFNLPAADILATDRSDLQMTTLPKMRPGLHTAISFKGCAPSGLEHCHFVLLLGVTEQGRLGYKVVRLPEVTHMKNFYLKRPAWLEDDRDYTTTPDHERWRPLDLEALFEQPTATGQEETLRDVFGSIDDRTHLKALLRYGEVDYNDIGNGIVINVRFEIVQGEP